MRRLLRSAFLLLLCALSVASPTPAVGSPTHAGVAGIAWPASVTELPPASSAPVEPGPAGRLPVPALDPPGRVDDGARGAWKRQRPRTVWVCRPGMADNPCLGGLGTTVVASDGSTTRRPFERARTPAFDCFYAYPTISKASQTNAPRRASPEVVYVARAQAALFQRSCRLFVPAYRQITSAGLAAGAFTDAKARRIAQRDIDRAFDDYLARYNKGRPFLLLGHSQGAFVLTEVVRTRIDPSPRLRGQLVSAMLIGGGPWLSPGSDTQGSFAFVPPCASGERAGCVVAFNTYGGQPPSDALFGRTVDGRRVICTDPAALAGGDGLLDPIVPVPDPSGRDVVRGFWEFTGSATARCRATEAFTWLEVARTAGSRLPELAVTPTSGPAWGLHRVDVTIALGDLIDLATRQAAVIGR